MVRHTSSFSCIIIFIKRCWHTLTTFIQDTGLTLRLFVSTIWSEAWSWWYSWYESSPVDRCSILSVWCKPSNQPWASSDSVGLGHRLQAPACEFKFGVFLLEHVVSSIVKGSSLLIPRSLCSHVGGCKGEQNMQQTLKFVRKCNKMRSVLILCSTARPYAIRCALKIKTGSWGWSKKTTIYIAIETEIYLSVYHTW